MKMRRKNPGDSPSSEDLYWCSRLGVGDMDALVEQAGTADAPTKPHRVVLGFFLDFRQRC